MLSLQQLESHLWGAVDILRGIINSSEKILPLRPLGDVVVTERLLRMTDVQGG